MPIARALPRPLAAYCAAQSEEEEKTEIVGLSDTSSGEDFASRPTRSNAESQPASLKPKDAAPAEAELASRPVGKTLLPPGDGAGQPAPAPQTLAGWSEVLEKLNRTVRAAYLDARPEVDGSTLVLWFQYSFHHKKAQEQSAQLLPHVRAWLGDGVNVEYRLRDAEQPKAGARTPASPEDDPFVREVVRRFEGRVTRVKEVSE